MKSDDVRDAESLVTAVLTEGEAAPCGCVVRVMEEYPNTSWRRLGDLSLRWVCDDHRAKDPPWVQAEWWWVDEYWQKVEPSALALELYRRVEAWINNGPLLIHHSDAYVVGVSGMYMIDRYGSLQYIPPGVRRCFAPGSITSMRLLTIALQNSPSPYSRPCR